MTPTYGNTLMGLACSKPVTAAEGYKISYYAPQPRAVVEVVDFDDTNRVVGYGETGRAKLTTLTKEFFMPGFLERDEGEREPPCAAISLGRHQRHAPVPPLGRGDDRGRILKYTRTSDSLIAEMIAMMKLPVIRWGQPYESLEVAEVNHFATGEPIAKVSQAGGGIIKRDMRQAQQARDALLQFSSRELIAMLGKAADLYEHGTLPMGDGTQSPDDFVHQQSASTGLPEHMCRANMAKNSFVLKNMEKILECLTRGLDLEILSRGYGEEGRGVVGELSGAVAGARGGAAVEFAGRAHVVAAGDCAANGPGAEAGPQEPWTPYRIFAAFTEAGVPREAFSLYPGEAEAGAAVLEACDRAMIFGGTATVDRYRGNPEGAGARPGLLENPARRRRRRSLARLSRPDGREHLPQQRPRLHQLLRHLGLAAHARNRRRAGRATWARSKRCRRTIRRPAWPRSPCPAWAPPCGSKSSKICKTPASRTSTEKYGPRLVEQERASYLRPTIIHCAVARSAGRQKEYMFPFAAVVDARKRKCSSESARRSSAPSSRTTSHSATAATNATNIDRLNLGPIPTTKLNWLQPHEGNLIDFLFRNRALQVAVDPLPALPAEARESE